MLTDPKEEALRLKKEAFQEEPDRFIDTRELLFAVSRHPESKILGHYINVPKDGMTMSQIYEEALILRAFAERKIDFFMNQLDLEIAARHQASRIVPANGNTYMNNLRKHFRGK